MPNPRPSNVYSKPSVLDVRHTCKMQRRRLRIPSGPTISMCLGPLQRCHSRQMKCACSACRAQEKLRVNRWQEEVNERPEAREPGVSLSSIQCLTPLDLALFGTERKGGLGSGPHEDASQIPAGPRPCVSAERARHRLATPAALFRTRVSHQRKRGTANGEGKPGCSIRTFLVSCCCCCCCVAATAGFVHVMASAATAAATARSNLLLRSPTAPASAAAASAADAALRQAEAA